MVFSLGLRGAEFAQVLILAIEADDALAGVMAADFGHEMWFLGLGAIGSGNCNSSVALLKMFC
ncbi:MAG: hypothetical protein ACK47R_15685, partial [Planctomycetia bacterium]